MRQENSHPVRALSYAGYKGEECPVAFQRRGRSFRISEIIDRWVEENAVSGGNAKRCFRVVADDGSIYLLFYDSGLKAWFIAEGSSFHPQNV